MASICALKCWSDTMGQENYYIWNNNKDKIHSSPYH